MVASGLLSHLLIGNQVIMNNCISKPQKKHRAVFLMPMFLNARDRLYYQTFCKLTRQEHWVYGMYTSCLYRTPLLHVPSCLDYQSTVK